MAKKTAKTAVAKKAPRERVLGIAVKSTTKGRILSELLDGKWHAIESLAECRVKPDDSVGWRLNLLKDAGKRAERPFKLENDGDKVRLVFLAAKSKNGASAKSTAPKVKAKAKVKAATAGAEAETEVSRASVQDVPASDD